MGQWKLISGDSQSGLSNNTTFKQYQSPVPVPLNPPAMPNKLISPLLLITFSAFSQVKGTTVQYFVTKQIHIYSFILHKEGFLGIHIHMCREYRYTYSYILYRCVYEIKEARPPITGAKSPWGGEGSSPRGPARPKAILGQYMYMYIVYIFTGTQYTSFPVDHQVLFARGIYAQVSIQRLLAARAGTYKKQVQY